MDEKEKCCICGQEIKGVDNDPYPVREEGRCCQYCNYTVVLPERIRLSKQKRYEQGKTDD
jgi:hypothetical protein